MSQVLQAKLVIKWGRGSAAIHLASLRLSLSRGGCVFPTAVVFLDHSLLGRFGLGFYRVSFVFGSRHLKAKRCPRGGFSDRTDNWLGIAGADEHPLRAQFFPPELSADFFDPTPLLC